MPGCTRWKDCTLSDPTWDNIEQLKDRLEATGFHESWAYTFLTSVLNSRVMPTGRGDGLLREFLATDWDTRAARAAEIEALFPVAGLDESWLRKLAFDVRRGYDVPDWREAQFQTIKDKIQNSEARVRTAEEVETLRMIERLGSSRGYRWWDQRPAQRRRYDGILRASKIGGPIYDTDYTWILDMFKGPLNDLKSDKHPVGALRYVRSYGDSMMLVISKPYIQDSTGSVFIDILPAGGVKTQVPFSILKKRK